MNYTEAQLISFGKYLLSSERTQSIASNDQKGLPPLVDRLKEVYDADVANWKDKEGISRSVKFEGDGREYMP